MNTQTRVTNQLVSLRRTLILTLGVALLAVPAASASVVPSTRIAAADAATAAPAATTAPAAKAKPATRARWARIVAAAKREGSVTLYSPQNPVTLAEMGRRFQARYGIRVTINRQIDSVLHTQVNAEHGSGRLSVDVWVSAAKPLVLGAQQARNRWVAPAVGPSLFAKAYNRKLYARPGNAVVVGTAALGMGWNTRLHRQGLKQLPDILNPRLKGRIGVPAPAAASFVDWYLWLQETYGRNFLRRLAALEPKIYPSSLPMAQAVASGEIAAGSFTPATTMLDLRGQGAPVNFKLWKGFSSWNAPFWAMIMRRAPHPNAAQLLVHYLATREGQATSRRLDGAILKGVPNTFYMRPREQKLSQLTPGKVAAFQRQWDALFRK